MVDLNLCDVIMANHKRTEIGCDMKYGAFRRRIRHNTAVLKKALDQREKLITILPNLYTMTTGPGELHSSVMIRNAHDILPSAFIGALASINANGTDAYQITPNDEEIQIELKTSEIDSRKVWKGVRGGLYTGKCNSKASKVAVTSHLNASYQFDSEAIKNEKRVKTVLIVCDTASEIDTYFDAWEIDGNILVDEYLHNKTTAAIKLGSFMLHGKRAKTVVDLEGIDTWKKRVGANAPIKYPV